MKSPKSKIIKKELKKKVKADIEVDLTKKIKDFVLSLGHDAESISSDIKKVSKLLSKKIVSKIDNVKKVLNTKLNIAAADVKKATKKDIQKVKKEVAKIVKEVEHQAVVGSKKAKKLIEPVVKQVTSIKTVSSVLKSPVDLIAKPKVNAPIPKTVVKPAASAAAKPTPAKKTVAKKTTSTVLVPSKSDPKIS